MKSLFICLIIDFKRQINTLAPFLEIIIEITQCKAILTAIFIAISQSSNCALPNTYLKKMEYLLMNIENKYYW